MRASHRFASPRAEAERFEAAPKDRVTTWERPDVETG
jgi:hypothetical protein